MASSIICFLVSEDNVFKNASISSLNLVSSLFTAIDTDVSVKSISNPCPSSNST